MGYFPFKYCLKGEMRLNLSALAPSPLQGRKNLRGEKDKTRLRVGIWEVVSRYYQWPGGQSDSQGKRIVSESPNTSQSNQANL